MNPWKNQNTPQVINTAVLLRKLVKLVDMSSNLSPPKKVKKSSKHLLDDETMKTFERICDNDEFIIDEVKHPMFIVLSDGVYYQLCRKYLKGNRRY
jgi:hypothetical protein